MRFALGLQAPAKLNLFLHVIGRRDDGYHELQSVFVPIDLADTIDLEIRDDGVLQRDGDIVGDLDRDLALRAARGLQAASGSRLGAIISVAKRIPAGSGLGGGSSDAAATLLALNRLWRLDWPRARLADLAATLGADVPFSSARGRPLSPAKATVWRRWMCPGRQRPLQISTRPGSRPRAAPFGPSFCGPKCMFQRQKYSPPPV